MRTVSRVPHQGPSRSSRLLASLAYLGPFSLLVAAALPRSPFIRRHSLTALTLHLLRFAWSGLLIFLWTVKPGGEPSGQVGRLAADLGLLLLTGVPWLGGREPALLSLLALPLGFTWLLALAGGGVAYTGHTLDYDALLHADWPDDDPEPVEGEAPKPTIDERAYARALRERQLTRVWNASLVAQTERRRRERIDQVKAAMETVLVRLDYLNHLLSFGELSLGRFTVMHGELIPYLDALRRELVDLQARRAAPLTAGTRPAPPWSLTALPEVKAVTLAVVDRSGVPIFTYGQFPLEEALITGMVSALDSLAEEMFGSRVHKTQLAAGQVVHFARGQRCTAFAVFEDDPAPAQIGQLRAFLDRFERENAARLDRLPLDPSRLTEVPVPFAFLRRLPGGPAAAAVHAPTSDAFRRAAGR